MPVRRQILEGLAGGMEDNNVSSGRPVQFGTLYLDDEPVGGMQSFTMREQNGTSWVAQAGNDWLEPRYGMRFWSGDGSRFQVRGKDIAEILQLTYQNMDDMDFRYLPFTLHWHYHYVHLSGKPSFEDAMWHYHTVLITDYTWRFTGPTELMYEDFTFIAKGYSRADNQAQTMSVPSYLLGAKETNFSKALVA